MNPVSNLAGVRVGGTHPVRLMGVINVSPESFYKGSVPKTDAALLRMAKAMIAEGADFLDVGAMSTAPYLKTQISEIEEARRLSWAVRALSRRVRIPISIDSARALPAEAGLKAGGSIVNDVTGFLGDPRMPLVAKKARGVILMANECGPKKKCRPIERVKNTLKKGLAAAMAHGIPLSKIAVDPGIGFFRNGVLPWWQWDVSVLRHLRELEILKAPVLIGVSRKSFIGKILDQKNPEDRLAGSLAATTVAVLNGAAIVRTHDVGETRRAIRMAESLR